MDAGVSSHPDPRLAAFEKAARTIVGADNIRAVSPSGTDFGRLSPHPCLR